MSENQKHRQGHNRRPQGFSAILKLKIYITNKDGDQ